MPSDCDPSAMAGTTEAHERFKPFVGKFKAEVKMWMGPGDPMVAHGVMTNTADLGGKFLEQRYQGDVNDPTFPNFQGRGYWGYNTIEKKYEGFWIDSVSSFMQTERGDVDASGKVWTMVGDFIDPQSGQPMKKRSIIKLQDNDHHSMEMYFVQPDGKEMKGMEINYVRQS